MTIKQITDLTGLSKQTVINRIKNLYPAKIEHGKTTRLNKEEAIKVVNSLRVEVSKNLTVESKELTVKEQEIEFVTKSDLAVFAKELVKSMMIEIIPIIQNNINQPKMITQDYYSILGFCNLKNIKLTFSEAVKLGRQAKRLSLVKKCEVREIPDDSLNQIIIGTSKSLKDK